MGQTLFGYGSFQKTGLVVALIIAYPLSFYIFDFYNIRRKFRNPEFLASMGGAFALAYLFAILSFYIFPYKLGRGVFLISWALTALLVYAWRFFYSTAFKLSEPRRNVLILGNEKTADTIIPALKNDPVFRLSAIMDRRLINDLIARQVSGGRTALEEFVEETKINDIVVSFDADNSREMERALVNCRMQGIGCYAFEAFYERLFEKLPILMLNDRWFLMSDGFDTLGSRPYKALKRTIDFIGASIILVITLPVSLIAGVLIPLTSKGSAFFTQYRLGAGKAPFKIIKFRTMVRNAEGLGPQWAQDKDPRVTALGRILRKTRIDEIPQLINVLKGDMSLIGPRPEREHFVNQLTEKVPFYSLRFFVKPGLTGWAQVKYRYGWDEADALEKLRYELFYIKNQSLALDARILMKTIRVVMTGQGT